MLLSGIVCDAGISLRLGIELCSIYWEFFFLFRVYDVEWRNRNLVLGLGALATSWASLGREMGL